MTPPTLSVVAERGEADDRDRDRLGREHGGLVADGQVGALGASPGRSTTSPLACGARPSASVSQLSSGSSIQLVAMVGGPSPPTGSPSAPISWADAADLGDGGGDAVDGGDVGDHRLVDEAADAALVAADAGRVADDDVGAGVGRGERVAEAGLGGRRRG